MTQEEYEQEQREIERLIEEINALIQENNLLRAEIQTAVENIEILQRNLGSVYKSVEPSVRALSGEVQEKSEYTAVVNQALEEMTERFFTFKNLSTASKNVTQYTDEYYTRFSYYNNLRRITLGYVIGLDANFVNSEHMREIVEKAYLQNSDYWLAYATMAVMLWASDEQEAAVRALEKAMHISPQKAAMFFMLINLRFSRKETAYRWLINYMERVNANDLDDEWKYLLQAYLSGAFGQDEGFQAEIGKRLKDLVAQAEATTADLGRQVSDKAYAFADTYLHRTDESYAHLKGTCGEYDSLMDMLSSAEKNALIAQYYGQLYEQEEDRANELAQRIENVLYALVNSYDDEELKVVKRIRENEAILAAQGDLAAARRRFAEEFPDKPKRNFADLLTEWAFTQDEYATPLCVRKFSVSMLSPWIVRGFTKYAEQYRQKERQAYTFNIDGCGISCTEHDYDSAKATLESHYEKNKWKDVFSDKYVLIELALIIAGLLTLVIMGVQLPKGFGTGARVALVMGILLVLVGVFLLWRQLVAVGQQRKEKIRLGCQRLRHSLEELGQWREAFHAADEKFEDLKAAMEQFEKMST